MEGILGFDVTGMDLDKCIEDISTKLNISKRKSWLGCLNPHSYVITKKDGEYTNALLDADWLVPDGVGILVASYLLGGDLRRRITGSDIFEKLSQKLNSKKGYKYYFLGSTESTLAQIKERMKSEYPNIKVVGTYSPPFKEKFTKKESLIMIKAINKKKPDVLWVGMTAPKQEKWIYQNKVYLRVKFIGAIGAVFDFYSGKIKRSHPIFRRLGLEWLPRLLNEPGRLWKRMFISAPIFLLDVVFGKVKKKKIGFR